MLTKEKLFKFLEEQGVINFYMTTDESLVFNFKEGSLELAVEDLAEYNL